MKEIEHEFRLCFGNQDKKRIFPQQSSLTDYKSEVERMKEHVTYIQKQINQVSSEK